MADLSFSHVYQPAPGADRRTLLLLHGYGGHERDMLSLARLLQPTAGVLSPRGQVEDRGQLRFFKRLPEGVYDLVDLARRAAQLAAFVAEAAALYRFDAREVMAVGFAEGANIGSTLLLAWPETLAGAVLFRASLPMMPDRMPRLPGTPVFVSNGRHDPVASTNDTGHLAALLEAAGADVTMVLQQAAHQLTHADVVQAQAWLRVCGPRRNPVRMS